MDDFSDAPTTIGELRAERSKKCEDWSPRDVLITLLRDIDSGTADVEMMVVVYRVHDGSNASTKYMASTPSGVEALGMLARAEFMINHG